MAEAQRHTHRAVIDTVLPPWSLRLLVEEVMQAIRISRHRLRLGAVEGSQLVVQMLDTQDREQLAIGLALTTSAHRRRLTVDVLRFTTAWTGGMRGRKVLLRFIHGLIDAVLTKDPAAVVPLAPEPVGHPHSPATSPVTPASPQASPAVPPPRTPPSIAAAGQSPRVARSPAGIVERVPWTIPPASTNTTGQTAAPITTRGSIPQARGPAADQETTPGIPITGAQVPTTPRRVEPSTWLLTADGVRESFTGPLVLGRCPTPPDSHHLATPVPLPDRNNKLSRTHAVIELRDGRPWVTDLDSINGTAVVTPDGKRIKADPGVAVPLDHDYGVLLGPLPLHIQHGD